MSRAFMASRTAGGSEADQPLGSLLARALASESWLLLPVRASAPSFMATFSAGPSLTPAFSDFVVLPLEEPPPSPEGPASPGVAEA